MSNIIRTVSNNYIDLSNFHKTIDNVTIEDIAHSGSQLCRYGGHSKRFCPINDHSRLVSYLVKEKKYKPLGLGHDTGESYYVEVPRPLKILLPNYRKLEHGATLLILNKYKIFNDKAAWERVKEFDELAYLIERVVYWGDEDSIGAKKILKKIDWEPAKSFKQGKELFLKRWRELDICTDD